MCSALSSSQTFDQGNGALRARTAQRDLYNIHLRNQYQDRCVYWRMRAESRLGSPEIVLTVDSMDQAKFMYPRGDVFRSKELSTFQRPRSHIISVIAHGYFTCFSVSAQDLPKDSSTMIELVGHCLTLLQNHRELTFGVLPSRFNATTRQER